MPETPANELAEPTPERSGEVDSPVAPQELKWEIAGGSVVGRDHVAVLKNNQDNYYFWQEGEYSLGIVCDGCGEQGKQSEMGSSLGTRIIAEIIRSQLPILGRMPAADFLEYARLQALGCFNDLVEWLGKTRNSKGVMSRSETISQYLLFTTLGFAANRERTIIFSIGDGVVGLNGEIKKLEPNENNEPVYMNYGLVQTTLKDQSPDALHFVTHWDVPTDEVKNILIGTDGVNDLIAAQDKRLPGKQLMIGGIQQFWEQDIYFKNPDGIRRRLTVINKSGLWKDDSGNSYTEHGPLHDDTTLIVARRV